MRKMSSRKQIRREDWREIRSGEKNGRDRERRKGKENWNREMKAMERKLRRKATRQRLQTTLKRWGKKENENSWKAKKGKKKFPAEFPIPRKLEKTDRQNKRNFASIASNGNKSEDKSSTTNANAPATRKLSKVNKPSKERKDISISSQQTAFILSNAKSKASDRKRKGTRRKEQERKDESNFTDMVNKYKNKLFGKNENETPAKRSRWFDD